MKQSWLKVLVVALMIAVATSATIAATSTTTKSKPAAKSSAKSSSKTTAKSSKPASNAKGKQQPAKAKSLPKLIDFGAEWCRPCKMQKPIIDEITKEYKGKVKVEFIDIDKNKAMADKYKIQAIPVQLFLDAKGKEVYRHVGFMPKEDIVSRLKDMGVK